MCVCVCVCSDVIDFNVTIRFLTYFNAYVITTLFYCFFSISTEKNSACIWKKKGSFFYFLKFSEVWNVVTRYFVSIVCSYGQNVISRTGQFIAYHIAVRNRIRLLPAHYKTHTYTHPHITKHTHTHTHTLQKKLKQPQNKLKQPQYTIYPNEIVYAFNQPTWRHNP